MSVLLRQSLGDNFDMRPDYRADEAKQPSGQTGLQNAHEVRGREGTGDTITATSARLQHCDWVYTLQRWQEAEARTESA